MIKSLLILAGFVLAAPFAAAQSTTSFADVNAGGAATPAATSASGVEKTVRDALAKLAPGVKVEVVEKSDLPGFYEVVVSSGQVLYVSADGRYLVQGEVYDVVQKSNLTSRAQATIRLAALKSLPQSKRLVFAPANPKHTITVFTDVDCPYCRQFHKQIAAYNQAGIAVEYVLFPLSIHPGADKKAEAVWCSQDRNAAYTAAMNGQDPGQKTCPNPIAETTALAMKIGIGGTPTIL
ncbi:MAG: DsbC family protein, partial [Proteobacteria bacterium]|nr:DsbC family protein [Pseudomonadota bacterium]